MCISSRVLCIVSKITFLLKLLNTRNTSCFLNDGFFTIFEIIWLCSIFRFSRYELPGTFAFNFVLEDVLGGGGIASLRSDPQVSFAFQNLYEKEEWF